MRPNRSSWLRVPTLTCVLAGLIAPFASVAVTAEPPQNSQSESQQPLQEVTVTAIGIHDHRALVHAINGFVASHSAPSTRINQLGRWHEPVCPEVTGLEDSGQELVTREIQEVARDVGAPTASVGKNCPGHSGDCLHPGAAGAAGSYGQGLSSAAGFLPGVAGHSNDHLQSSHSGMVRNWNPLHGTAVRCDPRPVRGNSNRPTLC